MNLKSRLEILLDDENLHESISKAISSLIVILKENPEADLTYNAARIDKKIPLEPFFADSIKAAVRKTYRYIDSYLAENEAHFSDGSTKLARKIKKIAQTLSEDNNLSKSEIAGKIANLLNDSLPKENQSLVACHCIVAYFIQHCEIFSNEVA